MAIDLVKIDERIRKLQMLRDLAGDPEMAQLLQEFAATGASGSPVGRENGTAPKKGDLIQSVFRTVREAGGIVTVRIVTDRLKLAGFHFEAKKPEVAVGGALRKLVTKGKIKLVKEGSGREPNEYQV